MEKNINIVYIKTPQLLLVGKNEEVYTNRRAYNPEPTLPLLKALTEEACKESGISAKVINVDLRDDRNDGFGRIKIGELKIEYLDEPLDKVVYGVDIIQSKKIKNIIKNADVVGVSSNFAANANSVAYYIKQVKSINPKCEIWVGGTDASVKERWNFYLKNGADVIFRGDVFISLKKYLCYKFKGIGEAINIVTKKELSKYYMEMYKLGSTYSIPAPELPDIKTLSKFSECAEGPYPGNQNDFMPSVYVMLSRGCSGNCSFCTTWILRPCYRTFDYKTLDEHMTYYKKKGIKTIIIMDDSFLNLLKLNEFPADEAVKRINTIMQKMNSYGFKVEFGNGLELKLLSKHWDEIHEEIFRNCFRLYVPLEDLAYSEGDDPAFSKLMAFEMEMDLLRKIIELRKKGFPIRQLTFGIIIGKPTDTEEGLKRTVERAKKIKELFEGSDIEIAFTPYCNSFLPGTVDFAKYYKDLSLVDMDKDPEVLCYSMVSNRTIFVKDTKKIWDCWLELMNLNPAENYLKNFRKNGGVTLAKVNKKKALFVSMPPNYGYEKYESKEYRKLRNEYFTEYTIIRTNTTLRNVDSDKLLYMDNLHNLNYALLSFITIAKKEGFKTKYLALPENDEWMESFDTEYENFKPDIIYIGCSHSTSFKNFQKLLKHIREKNSKVKIVAGGQYLNGLKTPLEGALHVKGDGFLPVYWTLASDEPFKFEILTQYDVPKEIKKKFYEKYEAFPYPDVESFGLNIMPVGRIYFQMGCLNRKKGHVPCKFCGSLSRKELYLTKDIERVIATLDIMVEKLKTQHVFLGDESFFASYENAEKIISALEKYIKKKGKINLTFSIQTRLEDLLQAKELVKRFAKIGLVEVHFGLESSCQKIVNDFGGKLQVEHVNETLQIVKKNNVNVLCHFLIGLPGETKESMEQDTVTIERLVRKHLIDFPEFRYVGYFPGTPFYENADKFGIKLTEKNPEMIVPEFEFPGFEIATISRNKMVELLHERYRKTNELFKEIINERQFQQRRQEAFNKALF